MISTQSFRIAGYVVALLILALGAGLIAYAANMRLSPVYANAGPQLFPYLIGGLAVLIGLAALREAWAGTLMPSEPLELEVPPAVLMAAGLLVQILTIRWLGWIPTAAIVLVAGAQALRRGRLGLDLVVGVAVAVTTYLFFAQILGLRLPLGSLFG